MTNFEFRSCRAKKMKFFCHRALPVGGPKNFFVPNFFKHIQKLKFRRILKLEQQVNMLILLVTLNFGRGSHAHWVDPRPKLFWLVNPTHGWVKPAKSRQNPWYGPSPCVSLTHGRSVNVSCIWIKKLAQQLPIQCGDQELYSVYERVQLSLHKSREKSLWRRSTDFWTLSLVV